MRVDTGEGEQHPTPVSPQQPPVRSPQTVPQTTPAITPSEPGFDTATPATDNRPLATSLAMDPMDMVVPAGEPFSLRIRAGSPEVVSRAAIELSFDESLLTAVKAEPGRTLAASFRNSIDKGRVSIAFDATPGFDGEIGTVTFIGKSAGSVQVTFEDSQVFDSDNHSVEVTFVPATIRVAEIDSL